MAQSKVRRILFWILLPLALLFSGEVALRATIHAKYAVPGKSLGRWQSDPILGARMARNVYDHRMQTNDGGFRGDEDVIDSRAAGALRVLAYGGSTTLCWNVRTDESWPRQLETRLRHATSNPAQQVLNAGDINWSIGHIFARAQEEIPRLRPDFVILYTGINETINARLLQAHGEGMADLVARGEYGRFARNLPQASWGARHSLLLRALQARILRPLARGLQLAGHDPWVERERIPLGPESPALPPDPALLANFEHVLVDLIDLVQRNGGEVIFVVQARAWDSVALEHFTSYSREAADTAREHGAIVVDAEAALPPDRIALFYGSGIHFSVAGCRWFADLLYDQVFAQRLGTSEER